MTVPPSVSRSAEAFQLPGAIVQIDEYGDGLIHDTYRVVANAPRGRQRFILQQINQHVFAEPVVLMENIERIVTHVQNEATQAGRDPKRAIPRLIRTREGGIWHQADGEAWRMAQYLEGTTTVDRDPSVEQAHEIGLTFGRFLDDLADFPLQTLRDALPGYRDTQRYLSSLQQAVAKDGSDRVKTARAEIAFIEERQDEAMRLQNLQQSGQLPQRVIHGDTKLNNVLLDIESGGGVCVIDLDTVMPGLFLHDIGDCVREALVERSDQQKSLSEQDLQLFEAIVSGFLASQSQPTTALEIANIAASVSSITLELGARFLSDYLSGDIYFRTHTATDNLQRARQHFRLQQRIETSQPELHASVLRCACNA